jgi:hypothetical protein
MPGGPQHPNELQWRRLNRAGGIMSALPLASSSLSLSRQWVYSSIALIFVSILLTLYRYRLHHRRNFSIAHRFVLQPAEYPNLDRNLYGMRSLVQHLSIIVTNFPCSSLRPHIYMLPAHLRQRVRHLWPPRRSADLARLLHDRDCSLYGRAKHADAFGGSWDCGNRRRWNYFGKGRSGFEVSRLMG